MYRVIVQVACGPDEDGYSESYGLPTIYVDAQTEDDAVSIVTSMLVVLLQRAGGDRVIQFHAGAAKLEPWELDLHKPLKLDV